MYLLFFFFFYDSTSPEILKHEMKVFFVKYNDPIYVKLEKLDIMIRLASQANIAQVNETPLHFTSLMENLIFAWSFMFVHFSLTSPRMQWGPKV